MGVDSPSRKLIGTQGGRRRLSTLLALKNAKKRNTKLVNPSRDEMRECIQSQWCWWCDKGPWKSLAAHTSKAHFIMAADIREFAYLFKHAIICSPEHSYAASLRFKELERRGLLNRQAMNHKVPHVLGTAGRDAVIALSKVQVRKPAFIKAHLEDIERRKRPHSCPVCGTWIKTSKPIHCSPECSHIAARESCKRAMTPERKAFFNSIRRPPQPEQCRKQMRAYWDKIRSWPIEEQRAYNLKNASSRIRRVIKSCVICGANFDIIPSHVGKILTCRSDECKSEIYRRRTLGRKHTPESIVKMSLIAKRRHEIEGGRFGICRS